MKIARWLLLLCLAGPLSAAEVLRTAGRESPPIYDIVGGKAVGACPDLLHAITRQDPALQFDGMDTQVSLPLLERGLQSGRYDLLCGMSRTAQREQFGEFIGPLFHTEHKLLVRASDPIVVESFEQLVALSQDNLVLARRGSVFAARLRQAGVKVDDSMDDNGHNLRKLLGGRARFFYSADVLLQRLLPEYGMQAQLRILPTALASDPIYLLVAHSLPSAQRQQLQAALHALQQRGELSRILRQHGLAP